MSTRLTHAGSGAGYDDYLVSQIHRQILRVSLEPLFFHMETRDTGRLDHPDTVFLHVMTVIVPPAFEYTVGHLHQIMHPPNAICRELFPLFRISKADVSGLQRLDL